MKFIRIYILIFLTAQILAAQDDLPAKPTSWISDYAGVLSGTETATLNDMLAGLEQRSSNQIFIAIFSRIPENYYLEDYTVRLYEKWCPGLPDKDNGILIVVFVEDRKIRIEVGYGLEDVVTDAQSGRLISRYIVPEFRQGNYYAGLRNVLDVLIPAVEGKYQLPRDSSDGNTGLSVPMIFFILLAFIVISRMFNGPRSTGYGSRPRSRGGWFFPGPFIGGSGGGRSSGGFSGGGFSGGFGGMSGGGGASGSW